MANNTKKNEAAIQDFLAAHPQPTAQAPMQARQSNDQAVQDFLEQQKLDRAVRTELQRQRKLGNDVREEELRERMLAKREGENTQEAVSKAGRIASSVGSATSAAFSSVTGWVDTISAWASRAPTPGGVSAVLLVILFFLFVIVPVNDQGYTRVQLLFFTLTGRTRFKDRQDISKPTTPPSATSSSTTSQTPLQGFAQGAELGGLLALDLSNPALNLLGDLSGYGLNDLLP